MTPQRWGRIKDVFGEAFERPEAERASFLDSACEGDAELRAEVERLLNDGEESLLSPASAFLTPELAPGDTVAHYRIQEKLGEGGMGVVYKASDSRLGRSVALKFVKTEFNSRSQREARAVASLNHPNICTLHDVGPNYLVMELVEGPTLAERIAKGPIPIPEALEIARQIAEALEAAHEKGIVHRDLKPANIKLTADGKVKVLDFGLAKALLPVAEDSPTMTVSGTGMILGTAAYMSPEQASGKPVDKRADIWSFGVVLWEMLTGRRLFEGETITQTLADVLRGPIDFDKLPRETPGAIKNLLRRCLDRNLKNRLRDIGEARVAIEAGETVESAPGARRPWLAWSVAAAATLGLATLAVLHFREQPPESAAPVRFNVPLEGFITAPISPDGRKLAFIEATGRLKVYSLETGQVYDLTDSAGAPPIWSPDGRFLAYLSRKQIRKIAVTGGTPVTITDMPRPLGEMAWNQDDVIVFVDLRLGLFRVPASGGVPVQITALDPTREEDRHWGPSFLPDGRHFVYTRGSTDREKSGIYIGSVDAKPEQQSSVRLLANHWQATYVASADPLSGYLLFIRDDNLMAQPFDNRRMVLTGAATTLAEGVAQYGSGGGGGRAYYSASREGIHVMQQSPLQLTWYDRAGKVLGTVGEPAVFYGRPVISPDGTRVAVSKRIGDDASIWLLDSRDGEATRFTFGSEFAAFPAWSPDSSRIIFVSNRGGTQNLYEKPVNGGKEEEILLKSKEVKEGNDWSRDGRFLFYSAADPKTNICVLPLEGNKKPVPFLATEFYESSPAISPDGRWVAYNSNESGRTEVYVRSFAMSADGTAVNAGGKWQISKEGGGGPRWRADGRELYYRQGHTIMAVEITTDPSFRAGKLQPLGVDTQVAWTAAPDGQRFLVQAFMNGGRDPHEVILNWQSALKK